MHYFLRQVLPPDSDASEPIEIPFYSDEVHVGRRQYKCLANFPQISRDHAVFYKSEDGNIHIKDNNSLNGVFVNDAKIGSSLKTLRSGDVIGFGVVSSATPDGFVCILCSDIKTEEIEISDDDDVAIISVNLSEESDSKFSDLHISVLPESGKSRSQTRRDVTCCHKNVNLAESSGIRSVPEPQDGALNRQCKVKTDRSSSRARNEVTGYNNNVVNLPESGGNISTSEPRNGVKNIRHRNFCKVETKSPENISVRRCFVPLVRCDDISFQFPPDIKNPFQEESELKKYSFKRKKRPKKLSSDSSYGSDKNLYESTSKRQLGADSLFSNKRRRKHARILSSESSDDCAKIVYPNTSKAHRNADSVFSSNDGRDCQTGTAKLVGVRKRKISDVSDFEEPNCAPSSSTDKTETCHRGKADNSDTEAKSSLENQDCAMEGSYSQVEEIIYISDDDSYLNLQSSQDWARIKQEPEEMKDSESDTYKEIFERDSNYADDYLPCNPCTIPVQSQEVESIESIRAFVTGVVQKNSNVPESDSRSPGDCVQINRSVFPLSSQEAHSESSSEYESDASGNTDNKMRGCRIGKSTDEIQTSNKLNENKSIRKSSGKILLTEAKPMTYKPKRLRGRDENFVEKKNSSTAVVIETPTGRQKEKLSENDTPICESTNSKNSRNTRFEDRDYTVPVKRRISHLSRIASAYKSNARTCPSESRPGPSSSQKDASIRDKEIYKDIETMISQKTNLNTGHSFRPSTVDAVVPEDLKHYPAKNVRQTTTVPDNKPVPPPTAERVPAQSIYPSVLRRPAGTPVPSDPRMVGPSNKKTFSSPKSTFSLPEISFDGVVKRLLQMNTKWLQEQAAKKFPPPDVSRGAADLPMTYKDYHSYASSFYPMIMLEIWEHLHMESRDVYANKQHKLFYFAVRSYTAREDCVELQCESVVNESVCFVPREGVMAVLELKESSRKCSPLFGYIYRHKTAPLKPGSLEEPPWEHLPEAWTRNARHWTFYARIKRRDACFELGSLMRGNGLCYIRSKLRLADALRSFKHSPLLRDILAPRESAFATNTSFSSPAREYSSTQTKLIKCISDEIGKPADQPKIVLVRGPAGTGKTHAIIGLLEEVFYCGGGGGGGKNGVKILVTAPSDVAVDEIGCRLVGMKKQGMKLVRVGLEKQIHRKMLPYFVANVAKDIYWRSPAYVNLRERERQKLLTEINKLEMDPTNADRPGRIKYLRDQCRRLDEQRSLGADYDAATYEVGVLQESHVILSTLNSCSLSLFHKCFRSDSGVRLSCCIVDDAAQCTELEVLQPLMLGISKLVLIGDSLQSSPPVLSSVAANCGYGISMFDRLLSRFQDLSVTPVHVLTDQFRMHPAICDFPSRHFYANRLFTHPDIHLRYKKFPLHPYIVVDVPALPGPENEATVVSKVCQFVDRAGQAFSIGVVVPDQAKCSSYAKKLLGQPFSWRVEVQTADGFRGREKDVIVLSAFCSDQSRSGFLSSSKQLTSALTRARKCLIVCVNKAELMAHPHWRFLMLDAEQRKLLLSLPSPSYAVHALEKHVWKGGRGSDAHSSR